MQNRQPSRPLLFYSSQNQSPTNQQYAQLQNNPNSVMFQQHDNSQAHHQNKQSRVVASPLQITCDLSDHDLTQQQQIQHNYIIPAALHQHQYPRFEVYMRCVTWGRDSHGLFDYESRQIQKRNIKSYTGGKIIRVNNDVEFISKQQSAQDFHPEAKPLIVVHEKNGKFFVENDTLVAFQSEEEAQKASADEDVNNKMFIDYKLSKGDIIKLGRIKFKVKDFRTDNLQANLDIQNQNKRQSQSPVKQSSIKKANLGSSSNNINQQLGQDDDYWVGGDDFSEEAIEIDCGVVDSTQSDIICKVCWGNEQCPNNPLLNSCKCDGSVRFIHYECLKHWLKQKMQKKEEEHLISYIWKNFECEICKKPYPYIFKSNGRKYRLVDVDVPEQKNFLWLESLTFEKNSSRMVHLVMPSQQLSSFKLGRGHESDVRVSDISVSRCHAILKYDSSDYGYYLEDNLSKFGTLVLAKQAIELDVDCTKAVQIGRSVISFTVKPTDLAKTVVKTPSPRRQAQITQQPSAEEILRKKIEEASRKVSQVISNQNNQMHNVHRNQNIQVQHRSSSNVEMENPTELQHYLQSNQLNNLNQQDFHAVESHTYDNRSQQNLIENQQINQLQIQEQYNHQTLERFERIMQSVEQQLAERDQKSLNGARVQNDFQYQSPQRQRLPQTNLQVLDIANDVTPDDEATMKTQYKHQVTHNEWKYRQLLGNIINPELLDQSPLLNQASNYTCADKPSISFNQLKSKYGFNEQEQQRDFNQAVAAYQKSETMNRFEDLKDELDQDFVHVPEEHEEDPPLRLKSQNQMDTDHSPIRVARIDFHQYMNQPRQDTHIQSNYNRNSTLQQKYSDNFGSSINANFEGNMFMQNYNGQSRQQEKQNAEIFLSHSPSKAQVYSRTYNNDLQNQQTITSNSCTNHIQSKQVVSNHKASSSITAAVNHKFAHNDKRMASPEKSQTIQKSSNKFKYSESITQKNANIFNQNTKRTSSQSPWRAMNDDQDSYTIVTPVKQIQPALQAQKKSEVSHQTVSGLYKNIRSQNATTYKQKPTQQHNPSQISPNKYTNFSNQVSTPNKNQRKEISVGRQTYQMSSNLQSHNNTAFKDQSGTMNHQNALASQNSANKKRTPVSAIKSNSGNSYSNYHNPSTSSHSQQHHQNMFSSSLQNSQGGGYSGANHSNLNNAHVLIGNSSNTYQKSYLYQNQQQQQNNNMRF
eukprot:403333938